MRFKLERYAAQEIKMDEICFGEPHIIVSRNKEILVRSANNENTNLVYHWLSLDYMQYWPSESFWTIEEAIKKREEITSDIAIFDNVPEAIGWLYYDNKKEV